MTTGSASGVCGPHEHKHKHESMNYKTDTTDMAEESPASIKAGQQQSNTTPSQQRMQ